MHLPHTPGWHLFAVPVLRMKPGDFPLGSNLSRAAARAALARRFASRERLTLILDLEIGCTEPRIGEWREGTDGKLVRLCALPDGMTPREAERIVSKPGWKPSPRPPKPERIRPPLKPEW